LIFQVGTDVMELVSILTWRE